MGTDTTQKIRMFFVNKENEKDSNKNKELAMKTFKEIEENKIFKENDVKLSLDGKFPIVELECDSPSYWLERRGLRYIQENVDDTNVVDKWPANYWHNKGDFCKHFNCILELETWVCPVEGYGYRLIVGPDRELWFYEADHAPFYGRTTVEQLFEGYERYMNTPDIN